MISIREYKHPFLSELATWLMLEYRHGNVKKCKRIAKVILRYNGELNYDELEYDRREQENSSLITPRYQRILNWGVSYE